MGGVGWGGGEAPILPKKETLSLPKRKTEPNLFFRAHSTSIFTLLKKNIGKFVIDCKHFPNHVEIAVEYPTSLFSI